MRDKRGLKHQKLVASSTRKGTFGGMFDKREKLDNFQVGDWVLKWDAVRQDKGKHGKFNSLWIGPFVIAQVHNNNTFKLENLEGEEVFDGLINGRFLKTILFKALRPYDCKLVDSRLFCFQNKLHAQWNDK